MRFSRLLGGASGLASAAADILTDDDENETVDTTAGDADAEAGDRGNDDATGSNAAASDQAGSHATDALQGVVTEEAAAEQVAAARAEERKRVADVFASEHVKGREAAAICLLTETDMAAERIVAKLPTLAPAASADPMLASLARAENPDLGAGAEQTKSSKAEANAVWDRTEERLGWNKN